ncbi:protein-disulfide reductase DsbD domain-containing protein [Foetidibacter luteolus]|uniref:protein-disulfide reductase DsbD domain-containing protein n=1 Tax=Foetidibacter luteolus TaxID=2608880 RepID=UPI00129A4A18|nr:protein-disulfide reductase DsbD domain-containing protein [Foetidibacter luteolus]
MKYLFTFILILLAGITFGQVEDPVQWSYTARKKADNLYELVVTATLPKPWHIYSQSTPAGGPVPTRFIFKTNPLLSVTGKPKEVGALQTIKDENFGVDVKYYSNKVEFVQSVKLKGKVKTNISGTVEYMVCNDERCLPPTKKTFDVKLL